MHLKSDYAKRALSDKPYIKEEVRPYRWEETPVVVLQVMVVGDMEAIAEIVREEDYTVITDDKPEEGLD